MIKGLPLRIFLLENIFYTQKISGMHLLNGHMNTMGLLLYYICANQISEYNCVLWIMFKSLLPKDKYLGGFVILLCKPLLKTGNDEPPLHVN